MDNIETARRWITGGTEQDVEARLEKSEQFSGRWIIRGIKISLEGQVK